MNSKKEKEAIGLLKCAIRAQALKIGAAYLHDAAIDALLEKLQGLSARKAADEEDEEPGV